jgi:hypothetical protein
MATPNKTKKRKAGNNAEARVNECNDELSPFIVKEEETDNDDDPGHSSSLHGKAAASTAGSAMERKRPGYVIDLIGNENPSGTSSVEDQKRNDVIGKVSSPASPATFSSVSMEKKRTGYVADLVSKVSSPSPAKRKNENSPPPKKILSVYILQATASGESIGIAIPNAYLWKDSIKALGNVGSQGQTIGECKFSTNLPLSIFYRGINNGVFLEQYQDLLAGAWYLCNPLDVFDGNAEGYKYFEDLAAKIAHGFTTTTGRKYSNIEHISLHRRSSFTISLIFWLVSVSYVGMVDRLNVNDKSVLAIYNAVKAKERYPADRDTEILIKNALAEACSVDKSQWDHI